MASRKPSTHLSVHQGILRTPASSNYGYRSAERFPGRTGPPLHPSEPPSADSQARYSISFVPGMSEHLVNTGKTLQDAQLKVVLFACEVERLNTQNYNLVKENEILKAQGVKTDREKDLEYKIAIVLAENEKLQQVVDELHTAFKQQTMRSPRSHQKGGYDHISDSRVVELLQSLEESKQRVNGQEGPQIIVENSGGLQSRISELEKEKTMLTERLARQERDLEALRARFAVLDKGPGEGRFSQQRVTEITLENERLRKELDTMRLQYGNASELQLKLKEYDDKIRILLHENDKLNEVLNNKIREQHMFTGTVQGQGQEQRRAHASPSPLREFNVNSRGQSGNKEREKSAGVGIPGQESEVRVQELVRENRGLAQENERLSNIVGNMKGTIEQLQADPEQLRGRFEIILRENEKLNQLLGDKVKEIDDLKVQVRSFGSGNPRFEQLNGQIGSLLGENKRLNDTLADKLQEIEALRKQARGDNVEQLEDKVILVTAENERLNREVEGLRKQVEEARGNVRLRDLSQQVSRLLDENNRLNEMVDGMNGELEELKRKNRELEFGTGAYNQHREQVNSLISDNRRLNDAVGEKLRENEALKRRISDLEINGGNMGQMREQLGVLTGERDRLSVMLDERVREVEALRIQIEDLNRRLVESASGQSRDSEGMRRRLIELETSVAGVQQLREQIAYEGNERERLNRVLVERQVEIDGLKRQVDEYRGNVKIDQLTYQVSNLADENRKLKEVVGERTRETDNLRKRIAELEVSTGSGGMLKGQLAAVVEERDQLHQFLVERAEEVDELKRQVSDFRIGNPRLEQMSEQVRGLLSENQRLNELVVEKGGEVSRIRKRVEELETCANIIDNLQEKVVFITTENERLNRVVHEKVREAESLRVQIEEMRREGGRDQGNVAQINRLVEDNSKLNTIISEKIGENEGLRRRLMDLEDAGNVSGQLRLEVQMISGERDRLNGMLYDKTQENEGLKRQMEELRGSSQKIDHLTKQITALIGENGRLNDLVSEKTRECDVMRRELESRGSTGKVETLVERVNVLLGENERLNQLILSKTGELELVRGKLHEIDAELNEVKYARGSPEKAKMSRNVQDRTGEAEGLRRQVEDLQADNRRLGLVIEEKSIEMERMRVSLLEKESGNDVMNQLKDQVNRLTREKDEQHRVLLEKIVETDNLKQHIEELRMQSGKADKFAAQVTSLFSENKRLNELVVDRTREIDLLRSKIVEIEAGTSTVSQLRDQMTIAAAEKENLVRLLSDRTGEVEALRRQCSELQSENSHVKVQVAHIEKENARVKQELAGKSEDLEAMRRKILEVEASQLQYRDSVERASLLSEEVKRLNLILSEKFREIEALKVNSAESERLRGNVVLLASENERLNTIMGEKSKEIAVLHVQVGDLRRLSEEAGSLRPQIEVLLEENRKLRDNLAVMGAGESDELRKQKSHVMFLDSEVERLNSIINQRNTEINMLHLQVGDVRRLSEETVHLKAQLQTLQEEGTKSQSELKASTVILGSENERLTRIVIEKNNEVNMLKAKIDDLSRNDEEVQSLRSQVHVVSEENRKLNDSLVSIRVGGTEELQKKTAQYEESVRSQNELKASIALLSSENERLTLVVAEKSNELNLLKAKIDDLSRNNGEIETLRSQVQVVSEESVRSQNELKASIALLSSENERLTSVISQKNTEIGVLQDKVSNLGKNSEELDHLRSQVQVLSEENRKIGESLVVSKTERIEEVEKLGLQRQESLRNEEDMRANIEAKSVEIERLNQVLDEKSKEIEKLQAETEHMKKNNDALEQLSSQMKLLAEENNKLNSSLVEKGRENDVLDQKIMEAEAFKHKIEELTQNISLVTAEKAQLSAMLSEKESEIELLKKHSLELEQVNEKLKLNSEESKRLSHIAVQHERDATLLKQKTVELEEESTKVGDLTVELENVKQECQTLSSTVEDKSREADDWKNKFFELQRESYQTGELKTRLQSLQAENERLNGMMSERFREIDEIRRKNAELQANSAQGDELKTKLVLVNQENDRVNGILQQKLREIETLKNELGNQEIQTPRVGELQDRLEALVSENDRLNERLIVQSEEVERLRAKAGQQSGREPNEIGELKVKLGLMAAENERLSGMIQEKVNEIELMKSSRRGESRTVEELEARIGLLMSENERLDLLLQDKLQEIEELRRTEHHENEIVGTGHAQREVKKSAGVRSSPLSGNRGENVTSESNEELVRDNERLRDLLVKAENEARTLSLKLKQVEQADEKFTLDEDYRQLLEDQMTDNTRRFAVERQALEGEILGLNQKIYELEEKIRILGEDNRKLSGVNEKRLGEIEGWKERYEQLERQKVYELETVRREAEERLKEEVELSTQHVKDGPEAVIGGLRREKLALEERIGALGNEVRKVKELLHASEEQLEVWRKKYGELENLRGQEIRELRKQFENFRKTNLESKEFQVKFTAERTAYETQILQWQQKAHDLENQVEMLITENERMIALSLERLKEVEFWKRKYTQHDETYSAEVGELKSQLEMFKSNNYDVKQLAIKYSAEKAADQSQIKQLKQMNENYSAELEKLYELMNQRKIDFDAQARQNDELRRTCEKLSQQAKGQMTNENVVSLEKFESLQSDIVALEHSRDQYKRQAERNSVELTRKNRELIEKIQELDVLKMKYEEALANYQAINARLIERLSVE